MDRRENGFKANLIVVRSLILILVACFANFSLAANELENFNPNGKDLGASCSKDSVCKRHLVCKFDYMGKSGQCQTAHYNQTGVSVGSICMADTNCISYTRCIKNRCELPSLADPCESDCLGALVCGSTKRCRPPVFGDPCSDHWMCPDGTLCRNSICRNAELGDVCDEKNLICGDGMRCNNHVCLKRGKGDICNDDHECAGALACSNHKCKRKPIDVIKFAFVCAFLAVAWSAAYIYVYNTIDNDDQEKSADSIFTNDIVENPTEALQEIKNDQINRTETEVSPADRRPRLFRRQQNDAENTPLLNANDTVREQRPPLLRNLVRSVSRRESSTAVV